MVPKLIKIYLPYYKINIDHKVDTSYYLYNKSNPSIISFTLGKKTGLPKIQYPKTI